jgi:hypothetical protein
MWIDKSKADIFLTSAQPLRISEEDGGHLRATDHNKQSCLSSAVMESRHMQSHLALRTERGAARAEGSWKMRSLGFPHRSS